MAQSCDRIVFGLRQQGFLVDVVHFATRSVAHKELMQGSYTAVGVEHSESHTLNQCWLVVKQLAKPDYLVSFGGSLAMNGAPIFATWLKVPLVTLIRGNDFDQSLFTPRRRPLLEDCLKASTTVCTVSAGKQWKIQQLFPNIRVEFVPNGIDLSEWEKAPGEEQFANTFRSGLSPEKKVIGLFGDLKPKKGVPFFLEALAKHNWMDRLHFLLVGEPDEELQKILTEGAIDHTALPFQDRYELIKHYLCCDAVAIPSFYDGMPNVLLEAGALGVPVLASQVDGMADVLGPILPQWLFEPGSEDQCRKVVYDYLQTPPEEQRDLGQTLKQHIHNHYQHHHETNRYLEIFA